MSLPERSATCEETAEPMGGAAPRDGSGARVAFVVAFLATLYPPLMTLRDDAVAGAFRYFASDAFYYLAVAQRSVGQPFYTFDGLFPTNGFHPLWQYFLTAAFSWLELPRDGQVVFAFVAGVVATAIGTGLFAAAMQRITRSLVLALLAAVPGFYFLLLPSLNVSYFSQWSFVNGMESPLSVLFFGVLCHLLVNRRLLAATVDVPRALLLAAVLTLLVLSRLDDVFLFAPFAVFLLFGQGATQQRWFRTGAFLVVPLICIGAYLAYNQSYAGTFMPVSGTEKSEGLVWGLLRNGFALLTTFLPFVDPLGRGGATWSSEAWRVIQMVVPATGAALWLAFRARDVRAPVASERDEQRLALTLLCVYVILKAGYNFALVRLWHQGQWYYPVSIMTFDWIVAAAAAEAWARIRETVAPPGARRGGRWLRPKTLAVCATLLLVLLHANAFLDSKRTGAFGLGNHRFWERRAEIGAALEQRCPGCGLIEFDDGILAYSLSMPVMNGLGLTLDEDAIAARRRGALFDVAWSRGFRLLASLNYPMDATAYADADRLRAALAANVQLRGQQLDAWDFETIYVDPKSGVAFVEFQPRGTRPPAAGRQP
jgi:hypothetical protein